MSGARRLGAALSREMSTGQGAGLSREMSAKLALMGQNVREHPTRPRAKARNVGRWPELVISSADRRREINDAVRRGELRPIASRIYTSNQRAETTEIVRRHWPDIASNFFPRAVVSDRSGASPAMVVDGNLFLVHEGANREIVLPGLALRGRHGPGPLQSDIPFGDRAIYRASDARVLIENMIPSRRRATLRRRLDQREIEEYLDRLIRAGGEVRLKQLADEIPIVAQQLGLEEEGNRALALVKEFLGTHSIDAKSRVLKARVLGHPFDPDRLPLLGTLSAHLASIQLTRFPADPAKQPEFPFFEAYFSNFIEGTEFEVEEAKKIVDTGEIPAERPKDAHDILGTYAIGSNPTEMSRVPLTSNELIEILRSRHRTLMAGRPEVSPGVFKTRNNKAGGTSFVDWTLVQGTLREGFEIGRILVEPFGRAIYLMFLIAEVHPFDDGNGRLARIFLNAELVSGKEQRILVPTSRRDDYLNALRLLSRQSRPELLPRVMADLQRYSSTIDWTSFDAAVKQLQSDGAFKEPPTTGLGALLVDSSPKGGPD